MLWHELLMFQGGLGRRLLGVTLPTICGANFLIIEPDPFLAMNLIDSFEERGAKAVHAQDIATASELLTKQVFDAALIRGALVREAPLPTILKHRHVPFLVMTAHTAKEYDDLGVAVVTLPYTFTELFEKAGRLVSS